MDLLKYAGCFSALYTDNVYLFEPGEPTTNDYGDTITTYTRHDPIKGSVQAYSGDLAYKEYGLQIACEKRIFVPPDTSVNVGWGFSSTAADAPELIVKWAPDNKTHRMILAGTR